MGPQRAHLAFLAHIYEFLDSLHDFYIIPANKSLGITPLSTIKLDVFGIVILYVHLREVPTVVLQLVNAFIVVPVQDELLQRKHVLVINAIHDDVKVIPLVLVNQDQHVTKDHVQL